MDTISGRVGPIIYPRGTDQKQADFFIFVFKPDNNIPCFKAKGKLSGIHEGDELEITGTWGTYKGKPELQVVYWQEKIPMTEAGLLAYLGSGKLAGVGKKTAELIVSTFGLDSVRIIEREPERLTEINGIGPKKANKIHESWVKNHEIKALSIFLGEIGISTAYVERIQRELGQNSINKIKQNPYCLTRVRGIGFRKADQAALALGVPLDSPLRCSEAFKYLLQQASERDGHVYLTKEEVLDNSCALLNLDMNKIKENLSQAVENGNLVIDQDERGTKVVYQPVLYYTEQKLARKLAQLSSWRYTNHLSKIEEEQLLQQVSICTECTYNEQQSEAIITSLSANLMVLTGGPGSGKTTTIKGIIAASKLLKREILLAAPTGRAAKRMQEVTGLPAFTIHRLLEFTPDGFKRNGNNPLEGDCLIVDEASMIDMRLMTSLTNAVPAGMQLILVGDIDQLPSVGAGNVLSDIIKSGVASVIQLTQIFRQAESSRIISNAYRINHGQMPILKSSGSSDFFFVPIKDKSITNDCIVSLVKDRLPGYFNCTPADIQVLSPMKKGAGGTNELNQALQEALNADGFPFFRNGTGFRVADKVMQIQNDYDKGVFNGDIGRVTHINRDENCMEVSFGGEEPVVYESDEFDELTLAYATTIHKSQGSEYPVVVISLLDSHYVMLQRNLLYTAITRAKRSCVIAGTVSAIRRAVENLVITKRHSRLKQLLQQYAKTNLS